MWEVVEGGEERLMKLLRLFGPVTTTTGDKKVVHLYDSLVHKIQPNLELNVRSATVSTQGLALPH